MKILNAVLVCLLISTPLFAGTKLNFAAGPFDPLVNAPKIPESLKEGVGPSNPAHYIVQFHTVPLPALIRQLSTHARFLNYFPENAYVVMTTPDEALVLSKNPAVRWTGLYQPFYKLSSDIGKRPLSHRISGKYILNVDLFQDADFSLAMTEITALGGRILRVSHAPTNTVLRIELPSTRLVDLAHVFEVQWIEEEGEKVLRNNVTRWVIQSNIPGVTSVWNHGVHGEGQVVGLIDGLIDTPSCYFSQPGKIVAIHNQAGTTIPSNHGTHIAGVAVGNQAPYGTADNEDGNAYEAQISETNLDDLYDFSSLYEALTTDHGDGARLHTNSWGDDSTTMYTQDCHDIDLFTHQNEDDVVMFAITNLANLKTPENAKNVLAVGASDQAPNQDNHCDGGAGPTDDGRRKPEIYVPGCNIVSADVSPCGTVAATGTSYASPAVAAGAALVRQYYKDGYYPSGNANSNDRFTPTGALIKATLLNGTVDMTGIPNYPSNLEGWGRLLLENALYFTGDVRTLLVRDVRQAVGFPTGSTGSDVYAFTLTAGQPFKVTLVWTDPESPVGATGTLINNIDLEVTTPDGTYKGNVFSGGESVPGGNFDTLNNVEQVLVTNPSSGNLTVKVIANNIPSGPQGYALVISGGVAECTNVPPAPTNLAAFSGPNIISLTWDPVSGATYQVERNSGICSDPFTPLVDTDINSYVDTSVVQGVTYNYVVRALFGNCPSPPSSCQSATPSAGTVVFSDNFDDGNADGWSFVGHGTASVINNELALGTTSKLTAVPTFAGCDDCSISTDVDATGFRSSVFFQYRDKLNYRELRLDQERARIVLFEKTGGIRTTKIKIPYTLNAGQVYHVLIQTVGGMVVISLDSSVIFNENLANAPPGTFQLRCKEGTCHFDNVQVVQ